MVKPGSVEEVDGLWVAAVLTEDAGLEARAGPAAFAGGDVDEPSDTVDVEALEGGDGEDAPVEVGVADRDGYVDAFGGISRWPGGRHGSARIALPSWSASALVHAFRLVHGAGDQPTTVPVRSAATGCTRL